MSSPQKTPPHLPTEILNMIIENVDNNAFLWTVGRQVSRHFRSEIEKNFQKNQLQTTEIEIDQKFFLFDKLSLDGETAFFKDERASEKTGEMALWTGYYDYTENEDEIVPLDYSPFDAAVQGTYKIYHPYLRNPEPASLIRVEPHTSGTFPNDTGLPGLNIHAATFSISFRWKDTFTRYFNEEYLIMLHKRQHDFPLLSGPHWPTAYPIFITETQYLALKNNIIKFDTPIRTVIRERRIRRIFERLGKAPPAQFSQDVKESFQLITEAAMPWLWKAFAVRHNGPKMDKGRVQGEVVWIEDAARNGWSFNVAGGYWVNPALEMQTQDPGLLVLDQVASE